MQDRAARSLVVAERPRRVDVLWGFLTLVFAAVLLRVNFVGSSTTTTIVVVDVVFGAFLALTVAAWIYFRRHPAHLEITPEAVAFRHRGQANATRLVGPGELAIRTTHLGGTDRLHWLTITGSDAAISLNMFDHGKVRDACRATGWRFVGDP